MFGVEVETKNQTSSTNVLKFFPPRPSLDTNQYTKLLGDFPPTVSFGTVKPLVCIYNIYTTSSVYLH